MPERLSEKDAEPNSCRAAAGCPTAHSYSTASSRGPEVSCSETAERFSLRLTYMLLLRSCKLMVFLSFTLAFLFLGVNANSRAPSLHGHYSASPLSGRRWRIGFPRCWPPSAAQTVHAVFPHTAFTKTHSSGTQSKVLTEPGLPAHTHRTACSQGVALQPLLRQRLQRCNRMRCSIQPLSLLKSVRTWARL